MKQKISKEVEEILKKNNQGIKLDIGCGSSKQVGFVGMDIRKLDGVDIVQDIEEFPWPLPDESVSFAIASHVLEHINPAKGTFLKFMDEMWRIMKKDGQFMIAVPYAGSPGYWQDPTHVNGITEATMFYFDPLARTKDGQMINLYGVYEVAPWEITHCVFAVNGNLEAGLKKRLDDPSYHKDNTIHYK